MKSVRLGKIEQESFIVQLLAPLPPQGSFEETYEYRVVPTLQSGLEALMRAAKQCGIDFDISHCINEVPQGLTANLCDAIVGMYDCVNPRFIEVSISYSVNRKQMGPLARICIDADYIPFIRKISSKIRACSLEHEEG